MTATAQLTAALSVAKAVHETIAEAGSEGVPSGVLYAALMGRIPGLTIHGFESLIGLLKRSDLITESDNHVLRSKKELR